MMSSDQEHEHLFDLITQFLTYEPRKRMTAADALKHPFFAPLTRSTTTHLIQSKRSLSSQGSSSSSSSDNE